MKACTMANATAGFAKCGIWPYDSDIFDDDDFAPASVTDILQPEPDAQEQEGDA